MNIITWAVLFATGFLLSKYAFIDKEAPVYTSMASLIVWLILAYESTNLMWASAGTEYTYTESSVAVFAAFNALLSGVVLFAAAIGDYGQGESAAEGVDDPTGGDTPWRPNNNVR